MEYGKCIFCDEALEEIKGQVYYTCVAWHKALRKAYPDISLHVDSDSQFDWALEQCRLRMRAISHHNA